MSYYRKDVSLSYWKLASGAEVDLILDDLKIALEIKSSSKITSKHLSGLQEFALEHPEFKKRIVVSLESTSRLTADGVTIYSYQEFLKILWEDSLS